MKSEKQLQLEEQCREIAEVLANVCRNKPGAPAFCLFLFNPGEGGYTAWMSSATRESTVEALREFLHEIAPQV